MTAEKATSWLPIPTTGRAELDIIDKVFSLEEVEAPFLTDQTEEREAEEQLRSEDSPMEYGSRLSEAKENDGEEGVGDDKRGRSSTIKKESKEDSNDNLDDQDSTKTPTKRDRDSKSSNLPPSTPPAQASSSSATTSTSKGVNNRSNERKVGVPGGRRTDATRGLGSLSSPLAKLFGAGADRRRSISPNFVQRSDPLPHAYAHPNAISKGTFRDDNQAEPHSQGMDHVPRELIDRLELIEKRSERIEVSDDV